MQPPVAPERSADDASQSSPASRADVAQREHDAFLHRLQSADVEVGVGVGEQRREVGRALRMRSCT